MNRTAGTHASGWGRMLLDNGRDLAPIVLVIVFFQLLILREPIIGLAEKLIITFNDVHEEVLANEKLLYQATRDGLTGLYNRAGFIEKAAELIAAHKPGYYIMSCVDIEKFRVVNDQYGTAKGDEVLCAFAERCARCPRRRAACAAALRRITLRCCSRAVCSARRS